MTRQATDTTSRIVRLSVQEFNIPPVRDCLVIGKESPIGCVALKKVVSLLHAEPFENLHPESDTIDHVLIRASILRKLPRQKLLKLMVERVAPLMSKHEIILVDVDVEVFLECHM